MRSLKLHTKTALLVSCITVALLIATQVAIGIRDANLVREEQREFAKTRAVILAAHISDTPGPRDPVEIGRLATLSKNQRANIVTVRYWERTGGNYQPVVEAYGSSPWEPIPEETILALRSQSESSGEQVLPTGAGESRFRVFASVMQEGRVSGAVEVVEDLDTVPALVWRSVKNALLLSVIAVFLISLATYFLFRQLVYRPVERLLIAMDRARAGDLAVQVPVMHEDELGRLSREFNNMIQQVREMSTEREARQVILRERIADATAELQRRNEQLADANVKQWAATHRVSELERLAAAGQTAAQFAHEVGTPLNTISGHVQLLRESLRDQTGATKRIKTISEQIERIERIVRQMLDRTRYASPLLKAVDLDQVLRDIFDAMAPALAERRVGLRLTITDALPPINGDVDRLQQAFINLINNALDAMPRGGELRVTTSERRNVSGGEDLVVVELVDTGAGMTPEVLAHIFDPLYTTKQRGRGTGLGLVVVRQVLAEHRATIEVTSMPNEGTAFSLAFPVASTPAELEAATVVASSSATAKQTDGQAAADALAPTEEPVEIGK
jgi:signal transduction histidine kinase